ncbi:MULTISPECIES: M23 family metallopeptidase [unclassified Robiginitalea]|uniref:M23 family metallopeptidase n=1 Tax=Robiginitalea TaxID=252306 RepID=UPI00234B7CAA|nr:MULTISPECIES: M23 family metallopeptidase [unclassified Robiginitalea]MDC6355180.1 M23 family metallopeptidase [Robiginitalea sp. PM2]MDC6375605.1 M23 family metallopeptidase [Robiginitalea sp. SP8]
MTRILPLLILLASLYAPAQYAPAETRFDPPLDIPIILAGTFGELRSNHFHAGIDIKTQQRQGLPVRAIADGTVSRIKVGHWGYGKALYIAHPNGYTSVYAHLQKYGPGIEEYVKDLQYKRRSYEVETFPDYGEVPVKKGDIIAYTGNTGGSSGPHLHFEIRSSVDEKPTNPLLYGIDVRDATNPTLEAAFAYPLSDGAHVNGVGQRVELQMRRQADGTYLADTLVASGTIGLGVQAYDRQDLAANRNGVYRIRQEVDGATRTDLVFEKFSFGETRYINTLIDYPYYATTNRRVQKCFRDSGNRLSLYQEIKDDGKIRVSPGSRHEIRIEISDLAGNETILTVPVRGESGTPSGGDELKTPYFIRADKPASFDLGRAQAYFPAGSFYQNTYLELGSDGDTVKLHKPTVPLHRNFTLSFDVSHIPEADRARMFIARLDSRGNPGYTRTYKRGNTFSMRSRELGEFTLATDTLAPTIRPRNFKHRQWLTNYRYLSLRIADDLSGIASYSATLNGKWILMEYEPKDGTITYNFDDRIGDARECELEVEVTDNAGNISRYSATFFRR